MKLIRQAFIGLVAVLAHFGVVQARVPVVEKPSPLFSGKEIPKPPQQEQAWKAPDGIMQWAVDRGLARRPATITPVLGGR